MGKIVPFYAADQPIVDKLCDIIRRLPWVEDHNLSPEELDLYNRIMERDDG